MTVIHTDGGCRGNPGPAAYGCYIEHEGQIVEIQQALTLHATNNVAEYCGLIAALRWAVAHNVRELLILMDSELIVRQMLGLYAVRHPQMAVLYSEAASLARQLPSVTFEYIPRAENTEADRLCNAAMDAAGFPHETRRRKS